MAKKIGYVISRFPSVFQPWVAQEIIAIKKYGYEIKIFSLKKPNKKISHYHANQLQKEIYYAPFLFSIKVIYSLFYFVFKNPVKLTETICYFFNRYKSDRFNLLKFFFILPKTLHYAIKIKKFGIKHIHAHWATFPALSALVISKLIGTSYSITCHAIDIFDETTMLEEKLSNAKFIVTCTKHNKQYLTATYQNIDQKKIFVNYHGKDLSIIKRKIAAPDHTINILSVGRLTESKGYDYLIEALNKFKTKDKINFNCYIVGDGPQKKWINEKIKKNKLEKMIKLTGALTHAEVLKYYEKSHIFTLSMVANPKNGYPHRGIPNVLAEAMAMEIPVITTSLPAIDELVKNGYNGILVPEKDSDSLYKAIRNLALSKDLRGKFGKNGRNTVKKMYDVKSTIKDLIDIFNNHVI
jgi:glycosyltransferase involved in cell wall biosynthesis